MNDRFVGLVPCLPPGTHPGMDALAQDLRHALRIDGLSLVIASADLREDEPTAGQGRAIEAHAPHLQVAATPAPRRGGRPT